MSEPTIESKSYITYAAGPSLNNDPLTRLFRFGLQCNRESEIELGIIQSPFHFHFFQSFTELCG